MIYPLQGLEIDAYFLFQYHLLLMTFSILPTQPWMDLEGFLSHCKKEGIGALTRLILSSDGSVTHLLEVLSFSPVEVELIHHETIQLDKEEASFLDMDSGIPAISRNVWLRTSHQRVMYAASHLPIKGLDKKRYDVLVKQKKSLGNLISENQHPVLRDKMGFAKIQSPEMANALKLKPSYYFWARRYRLRVKNILHASILEVFFPSLFSCLK